MAVTINWVRNSVVEDFLNHERFDWTFEPQVSLAQIDVVGAAANPVRSFLRFDQSNADGILFAMLDGIGIPPVILFDNGGPTRDVGDGRHRLNATGELAKRDGVTSAAGYVIRNASPRRQTMLAARLNINQGRQLTEEERVKLAIQWLRDSTCDTIKDAAANVGLNEKQISVAWKIDQMMERAFKLGVGDAFRDKVLARDGKDQPAARAFDAIQNDVVYAAAIRLCDKYRLNIKEMIGTAKVCADTRTEVAGLTAVRAADEDFAKRDIEDGVRTKRTRLTRGKLYIKHLKSADNVGPVSRFGLDGVREIDFDDMLATLNRIDRKNEEVRQWLLRLQEEVRRADELRRSAYRGGRPSPSASPPP